MIAISGIQTNPIYTRVIVSRSAIFAEIALHRTAIPRNRVIPGQTFEISKHGVLWIENIVQQGETYLVRAYDPIAYAAKHAICRYFTNPQKEKGGIQIAKKSAPAVYELITSQLRLNFDDIGAELYEPENVGKEITLDIRFDNLYNAYSQIPEIYDPKLRIDITPWGGANRAAVYEPKLGNASSVPLRTAQIIDYSFSGTVPNFAFVAGPGTGKDRLLEPVDQSGTNFRREIYLNAPLVQGDTEAQKRTAMKGIGENELAKMAEKSKNITVKLLSSNIPAGLKPADAVSFPGYMDGEYTVQSIEYTTSSTGNIAYVTVGGKPMSVADRLDAIIAADYAARY